jgi:hypothetical protein
MLKPTAVSNHSHPIRSIIAAFIALSLAACGSGDERQNSSFTGTWDVRYNLQVNECGIVAGGVPGFVDQHSILSDGLAVQVDAVSGFLNAALGEVREDGSFACEQTIEGDIFGDGIACTQTTRISYEPISNESASSLFFLSLSCADGFQCVSSGIGEATRQPLPTQQDALNG